MTKKDAACFRERIYREALRSRRFFPWRATHDPYRILVSEVMLQQTQAGERTARKYREFLRAFPTLRALARADVSTVLSHWQGLGYNRRAKALRDAARSIYRDWKGVVPNDEAALKRLPGVGPYTAAAVRVFAFNEPAVLIETNIRAVFIDAFFPNASRAVSDKELSPLVTETLDRKQPRQWYTALMDYGAVLKKEKKQLTKRSAHYVRQGAFEGSNRELRGMILRELAHSSRTERALLNTPTRGAYAPRDKRARLSSVLDALVHEGLIERYRGAYRLSRS